MKKKYIWYTGMSKSYKYNRDDGYKKKDFKKKSLDKRQEGIYNDETSKVDVLKKKGKKR
jgi:hypothetical protein